MWLRRKDKSEPPLGIAVEPVVKAMGYSDVSECWRLDQRCFSDGEAYDRETLRYLLSHNKSFCYKVIAPSNEMLAFIISMIEPDNTGHIVALGVAPEHRRKGYGRLLMDAVEACFFKSSITTVRLEVRTSNNAAQRLYFNLGYGIVRRMPHYYTSGDDGYLMVKNL
jgi:ribosomal-protein-alanine acetyltransferase